MHTHGRRFATVADEMHVMMIQVAQINIRCMWYGCTRLGPLQGLQLFTSMDINGLLKGTDVHSSTAAYPVQTHPASISTLVRRVSH